ncbi:MAG: hypothetical protein ACJAYJ_002967 [Saprospiraceae bacterium]|jgi:hypothetical protein
MTISKVKNKGKRNTGEFADLLFYRYLVLFAPPFPTSTKARHLLAASTIQLN